MSGTDDWAAQVRHLTESLIVPLMQTDRHNTVPHSARHESVAEHSFHVACVVGQLSQNFADLDGLECLKMALQHDFAEAMTGDVSVYASEHDRAQKPARENEAVRVLTRCASDTGIDVSPLAQYAEHTSQEAGFVCAVDKIVPYFLVMAGQGHHARPSPEQYAQTRARARAHVARCFVGLLPVFDEVAAQVAERVQKIADAEAGST